MEQAQTVIERINEADILREASRAVSAGDVEALGALIGETETKHRAFLAQALDEDRRAQKLSQNSFRSGK